MPDRLHDMLEAIGNVGSELGEMSRDDSLSDAEARRAGIERLIVTGEADHTIVRFDPSLKETRPAFWPQIRNAQES